MAGDKILIRAEFDPKLKIYGLLQTTWLLTATIICIPLLPLWLLGIGQWVQHMQFAALRCELTERSLNFAKGILFPVEKNVPLDKITDLAMHGGPVLRSLGLTRLQVETAGQSGPGALVSLVGIVDADAFRNAVIEQRDRVMGSSSAPASTDPTGVTPHQSTLVEIRDSLHRIETLLEERSAKDRSTP